MVILIILILALVITYKYKIKGFLGELHIRELLKSLPEKDYLIINNCLIQNGNSTTQIDHVVASIYGIFVIETKNYNGIIYGNEFAKNWTKYIFDYKYTFYNPIRQNYAHISALKNMFPNLDDAKFISIVAFSNNVKIKVSATKAHVIRFKEILTTILNYKEIINSYNDIYTIRHILNKKNQTTLKNSIVHTNNIKTKVAIEKEKSMYKVNSKTKINNIKKYEYYCNECGNKMIYHSKGRYGPYYSCNICKKNISEKKLNTIIYT